ncbi:MAG: TonB family protein [Dysgonamonadaceae bacterium]|jgi:protein TonB|nr:TonB family protein [Dysgonamonadaceae bacterium]
MAKDININSSEWCDMVFEGRNQSYGACKLRQSSSKRHIVALMVVFSMVIFISILPKLYGAVQGLTEHDDLGKMDEITKLVTIEQEIPPENIIKQEIAPPPPPLKTTIQYTVPDFVPDDEVTETIKTQEEVIESTAQVSIADVVGTDSEDAVDIVELNKGKVIIEEEPTEEIFQIVENQPEFPGGNAARIKFLNDNINYPVVAQEIGIKGRVICNFVIERDGSITDAQVIKGVDPSLDKEALRVIKAMPKWIPGKQRGKPVRVRFTLPIEFRLVE